MKKVIKGSSKTEIYGMKINDDLKKYRNGKRVLEKVAKANALIARVGLPSDLHENQVVTYENTLRDTEQSAAACEPQAAYGAPKKTEA